MIPSRSLVSNLSSYGVARSTIEGAPLSDEEARKTHAFWRACNYLALGMIYLQDNPLLREPLKPEHIKTRMLGHWGASPALSCYVSSNSSHSQAVSAAIALLKHQVPFTKAAN